MTFDEKISGFKADMKHRGEPLFMLIPPVYFLLWRAGFKPIPPVFLPFKLLFFQLSISFSLALVISWLGLIVILAQYYPVVNEVVLHNMSLLTELLLYSGGGGLLFGLGFGLSCSRSKNRLNLPDWDCYKPPGPFGAQQDISD